GVSRAYAGRMDGAGHLTGAGVRTIGTADAAVIVPFGNRYIAAWEEPEPGDARPTVISATLDRNFNLLSTHAIGLTSTPPFIRTSVGHAYLASTRLLYELDADGAPGAVYDLLGVVDDLALSNDLPAAVHHANTKITQCFFGCGTFDRFTVSVLWLYRL